MVIGVSGGAINKISIFVFTISPLELKIKTKKNFSLNLL